MQYCTAVNFVFQNMMWWHDAAINYSQHSVFIEQQNQQFKRKTSLCFSVFICWKKYFINQILLLFFFRSSTWIEKSIVFVKIFNFRFLTDLHILGCSEHNFTTLKKISVCASICCVSIMTILWQAWLES